MRVKWEKDQQIGFTGRNGWGFCCGVDVTLLNYSKEMEPRVQIAPITSKDTIGRCDIDIPVKNIPALINLLRFAMREVKEAKK